MVVAGPPPTQLPPDVKETPPKRSPTSSRVGRPPGRTTSPNAPSRRSLEPQIAATLMTFNLALMVIPPLRNDALDEMEITALAKALDAQAKESPRFRKMLESALAVTSGGQLIGVCAIIGARRAARHGIIPPEADGQFGALLAASLNQKAPEQPRDIHRTGTGGANPEAA